MLFGFELKLLADDDVIAFNQARRRILPCPPIPYVSNGLGRDLELFGQREDLSTSPELPRSRSSTWLARQENHADILL